VKVVEEDDDEKEEKVKIDKLKAKIAARHECAVKEHKTRCCWVRNDGQHIPLAPKDVKLGSVDGEIPALSAVSILI
jgi:hypothetical protein